jgi:uncharacterized membrane protein YjjP (DUF1212 family)
MTARQLVPIAADLGAILLRSGAEIRQVEEGLYHLFEFRGMKAEVFVLLKGIFLSAWDEAGEPVSLIRHVRGGSGVDLARLEQALVVAGALAATEDADQARALVAGLETPGPDRTGILVAAAAATAGIYGLFFGGTWVESLWAAGAAAGVQGLRALGSKAQLPALADVFLAAVLLSLSGLMASWVLPGADPVRVVTGGVMILIPGVALVNGVRDVLHGDTVSSLYRLAEAGLQTAAIAAGVSLVLSWGWPHV